MLVTNIETKQFVNYSHNMDKEFLSSEIRLEDFESICRVCLSRNETLVPLSSTINKDEETLISDVLGQCLALKVEENNQFPSNVCSSCVENLKGFYIFRKKCFENESLLRYIIEHPQVEYKPNENEDFNDDQPDYCDNDSNDSFKEEVKPVDSDYLNNTVRRKKEKELKNKVNKKPKREKWVSNKCKVCYEQFSKREELLQHSKKSGHRQRKIIFKPCEVCHKTFPEYKIKSHMLSHTKERPFKCPICSCGFTSPANVKRHMMTHTGERPHVCEYCGKGFIQKVSLLKHRKVHEFHSNRKAYELLSSTEVHKFRSNQEVFKCSACPRQFKLLHYYERHLKIQHSDSDSKINLRVSEPKSLNYECDICGKRFKERSTLRIHKKIHGEKLFLCNTCGKRFFTKGALDSHLRTHTGEKPYKCDDCGKAFSHSGSYASHILIHQGLKPYQCHICEKKFTQAAHLKTHLRQHTGEKPFCCSFCGKAFTEKSNMIVHERTHTGETPYLCPVCSKGFYDTSSRRKHCRSHGLDIRGSRGLLKNRREKNSQCVEQEDDAVEEGKISEVNGKL